MSYDVALKTPACDACKRDGTEVYSGNMTANVSGIWFHALQVALDQIPVDMWPSHTLGAFHPIEGMSGVQAVPVLEKAAEYITANPAFYKSFEPANGWGNARDVAKFLREIAAAWKEHPTAVLTVWR